MQPEWNIRSVRVIGPGHISRARHDSGMYSWGERLLGKAGGVRGDIDIGRGFVLLSCDTVRRGDEVERTDRISQERHTNVDDN